MNQDSNTKTQEKRMWNNDYNHYEAGGLGKEGVSPEVLRTLIQDWQGFCQLKELFKEDITGFTELIHELDTKTGEVEEEDGTLTDYWLVLLNGKPLKTLENRLQ